MFKDRRLSLIFTIILLDVIVGSAVSPVLPSFVQHLPNPQVWISFSVAIFLGMQLFSAPLLGRLSDAYGRRPILLVSTIGTFIADCMLLPIRAWSLFANRVSDGFTNGMYGTIRSTITDLSKDEELFRNMGIEGAIFSLGFVLGPMVSGIMLTVLNVPPDQQAAYVVAMAVIISGFNMGLSFFFPETHPNKKPIAAGELKREVLDALNVLTIWSRLVEKNRAKPGLMRLVLMQIALTFATGYYFYFVVYCTISELKMDARGVSYLFMYFGLLSVGINYVFYTYLADRIHQIRFILVFGLFGAMVLVGYASVGASVFAMYVWLTIDCLTLSLIQGLIEGLMARLTDEEDRGEIFGINQALQGLGSFVNTLVYGALSFFNLHFPFYWFAASSLVVGILAWEALKNEKK
jgi:DHA1 family tetracycline resistance protein-like MFS transporter